VAGVPALAPPCPLNGMSDGPSGAKGGAQASACAAPDGPGDRTMMSDSDADRVLVRPAALPAEAEALAGVYVSSAEHHAGLDPELYRVPLLETVVARYRQATPEPGSITLVAEVGGEVVGMASVRMSPAPSEASMMTPVPSAAVDIAVLPNHRGQGLGGRLMRAAEAAARQSGARRMVLDAATANERALRFYEERLGYRPFGILLAKPLPDESPEEPGAPEV
jgi:ribosomal protein S18 acetylase RimI-like enzyme